MEESYISIKERVEKERYIFLILFILDSIKDINTLDEIYHHVKHLWMEETRAEKEAEKAPNPGG